MSQTLPAIDTASALETFLKTNTVYRNLHSGILVEHAIRKGEGLLADNGALVGYTGKYTGRTPKDKFTVKDDITRDLVNWGDVNQAFDPEKFDALFERVLEYLRGRELYLQDLYSGADPNYQLPIRVINQFAWHNLFVRALFVRPTEEQLKTHHPEFTIVSAPDFQADPQRDGTRSEAFIIVNFTRRIVLIGGTKYAGEMKKSIFGVMNFLLPQRNVFPMHCSANVGRNAETALFFGLSGTGKTTLSADPERLLIGDDEHGWSPNGIFNFEGGCYAKCIKLSKENEPQIWNAIRFGSVLENVTLDEHTHVPDYNDDSRTENTRAAYPVDFIEGAVIPGIGGHPKNVIFLTADAFGVLPPISRLNPEQAMYHFLSGYTAKVAGTEAGVKEPQPNFSTCFGSPFLPLRPKVYAEMLGKRLKEHNAQCWLVNTGWFGGPYGVGSRMKLKYTRAMVNAAIEGLLNDVGFEKDPAFGLSVPKAVPGVPDAFLHARDAWMDKAAYDKTAADLSARFAKNFEKFDVPENVRAAGPKRG
ncbi:MAG TPA: phosphoenolpyruvate carboxykinase (ATP) [Candidatus Angelobacter sp.]|jgi:phosphoenolpyruvate carboxykinase (ATP)|nr:phosphoenolpyruvate carboxykinase (ATP) [Candidatus Angelobacter sp.]